MIYDSENRTNMANNVEPWNKVGVNQQNASFGGSGVQLSSGLIEGDISLPTGPFIQTRQAPPIPSRPSNAIQPYNNSYFSAYPYTNSYGNMNYYSNYHYNDPSSYRSFYDGSVVHQAEASTRQAFQNVETFVRTFSSISMMMESTLQAVTNSFRAIMGVIDHFSKMQLHASQLYSAISLIRFFKWFMRKLKLVIRFFRFGRSQASNDHLWAESESLVTQAGDAVHKKEVSQFLANLPLLMFFAVVVGGPWLLWKLASSVKKTNEEKGNWKDGVGEHYKGVVEFKFVAQREDEMSLDRGVKVNVAPKDLQPPIRGWVLVSPGNGKVGLVPQSYVKIIGKVEEQRCSLQES